MKVYIRHKNKITNIFVDENDPVLVEFECWVRFPGCTVVKMIKVG